MFEISTKLSRRLKGLSHKSAQIGPNDRAAFWDYCVRAESGVWHRSRRNKLPCNIDRYFIDELLVDQRWRCAVSGVALHPPGSPGKFKRHPFSPSIDRIIPDEGYVRVNCRIVCLMVNSAINEWGLDNFLKLVEEMR